MIRRNKRPKWWGSHRRGSTAGSPGGEDGFTIVETTVAMALVFMVLTGTLATFSASVKNLVTGHQRTGAVSLARAVIEDARSSSYKQVGHVLSDPTLATDPAVTGSPKQYEGEDLVGVPASIYAAHTWPVSQDAGEFTVNAYVTWVDPGTANPFKRVTVIVTWASAQYDTTAVSNKVRLSSFLFAAGVPPDPMVDGDAQADAGFVDLTGVLSGADLSQATMYNPTARGELNSLFVRQASGSARSTSSILSVNSGSVTGCEVDPTGKTSECVGITTDTTADSDASTAVVEHDAKGPLYDVAETATANSVVSVNLGANDSVTSKSTGRSCFTCYATTIGDDDRLAYQWSEGAGPDTSSIGYDVGPVEGSLVRMNGASRATATLDHDSTGTTQKLVNTARIQTPSVDVVTVQGAPPGFIAAVQIGAIDVTATAGAGPTVAGPSVTGGAITVNVWDTLSGGSLGYRTITVNPGEEKEESASSSFTANGAEVSLTTTVVSGGKSTSSTTDANGNITYAEAGLTNWLRITVDLVITSGGSTLADSVVSFDYGRLFARAQWQEG